MLSPLITLFFACNIERYLRNDWAEPLYDDTDLSSSRVLYHLPQVDGDSSPAALNGEPYVFGLYPSSSSSNATWTIYLQGGGWCYDEVDCYCRSKMGLGNPNLASITPQRCLNLDKDGNRLNCNLLVLPYLDGASFSGFRAGPVPVPPGGPDNIPENQTIYFRGHVNLVHTIKYALANLGLDQAQEVVLTGISAGGLATYINSDLVGDMLQTGTQGGLKSYHSVPDVGYFLDHDNFRHTNGSTGPNTPLWSDPKRNDSAPYPTWMKYVYKMQNLTFGTNGALNEACKAKFFDEPYKCFFSPHMAEFVKTPFFVLNSQHDYWQILDILQLGGPSEHLTASMKPAIVQYGSDFRDQLKTILKNPKNGAFITSCICHVCPWDSLRLVGKNAYEHYRDWVLGEVSGSAAIHIDTQGPDGQFNTSCIPLN